MSYKMNDIIKYLVSLFASKNLYSLKYVAYCNAKGNQNSLARFKVATCIELKS